ncbi:hypothetical protein [Actinomycetospora chiangmaiensis]|uniref:hypothetical protein n=1 Tax=Actinomycetospora chiangmaiensis TaxID=402650 RepID=UPI0003781B33|nr:hypothetical protein [Actinomycetospora chiangmaiensis]
MSNVQLPRADLSRINNALGNLELLQVQLGNTVNQVVNVTDATRGDLLRLAAEFEEFRRLNELAKNLQFAQTKIIRVNQELETQFGHHATVRRHATGILQALDVGVVTQETMYGASEELMLSTPRYWLAPGLVALAAWIGNDRRLAETALAEALRRDGDKTTLFYALTLRRYGRGAAANRWLDQYLARQDPWSMSGELTTVLDAMATGALGVETKPLVRRSMDTWFEQMSDDREIVENQVQRWARLLDGGRGGPEPSMSILPQVSPTWPQLQDLFQRATVHRNAYDRFTRLFAGPAHQDPDLRGRVDRILDNLVTNFDDEERPLRREARHLQLVIDHNGDDRAAAQAENDEAPAQEDTVDFLTLVTNAAFFPEQVGASHSTQLLTVAMAKDWVVQADGRLEADALRAMPSGVDLALEGWTGRVDGQATEQSLATSLAGHIDRETEQSLRGVSLPGAALICGVIGALFLFFGILAAVNGSPGGLIFCLLVALGCGGYTFYAAGQLPRQRELIRQQGELRRSRALATLKGAIAEVHDWQQVWQREMAFARHFQQFIGRLDRDAYSAAPPDQRREVML